MGDSRDGEGNPSDFDAELLCTTCEFPNIESASESWRSRTFSQRFRIADPNRDGSDATLEESVS